MCKIEDSLYHLLTNSHPNIYGFPGAWIPYLTDAGITIAKIEPVQKLGYCLSCEPLADYFQTIPMAFPTQLIISQMSSGERRPANCPDLKCFLYKGGHGEPYKDVNYLIMQELSRDNHSIQLEKTQGHDAFGGFKIAKINGRLQNGGWYKPLGENFSLF